MLARQNPVYLAGMTAKEPLPPKTTLSRHIWLYSEADWEGLNVAIINHDWQAHLDRQNVNEITFLITQSSFVNLARQFIPNKIVPIRKGDQPWYTNLLRSKRRQRDRLFRHAKLKTPKKHGQNIAEFEMNMFIVWPFPKKHTKTNKSVN